VSWCELSGPTTDIRHASGCLKQGTPLYSAVMYVRFSGPRNKKCTHVDSGTLSLALVRVAVWSIRTAVVGDSATIRNLTLLCCLFLGIWAPAHALEFRTCNDPCSETCCVYAECVIVCRRLILVLISVLFSDAFAKFRTATVSFVMTVHPH